MRSTGLKGVVQVWGNSGTGTVTHGTVIHLALLLISWCIFEFACRSQLQFGLSRVIFIAP